MNDRFRIPSLLGERLQEHKLALPALLRQAGLPPGFFQQEKNSSLFAGVRSRASDLLTHDYRSHCRPCPHRNASG